MFSSKALQDETTPLERAQEFKESGNTAYKIGKSRWNDAIIYYTQAIEEECEDVKLNSQLYANRAQVHLSLG